MALTMVRPTKHPKTGIYRIRKAIPPPLRETAKSLFGKSHEIIVSLKTQDGVEARARAPQALQDVEAKIAAIRAAHRGEAPRLPEQAVQALAGQFYQEWFAKYAADPKLMGDWDIGIDLMLDRADIVLRDNDGPDGPIKGPPWEYVPVALEEDRPRATELIDAAGYNPRPDDVDRVAKAMFVARLQAMQALKRRANGDWGEDQTPKSFPPLPPRSAPESVAPPKTPEPAGPSFDEILRGWARDHGWSPETNPKPRALYDRERTLERLADFLGHRDAARVTKADAVRWKEHMQSRDLKVPTIRNDISEMSAIWKHAIRNGKLESTGNPFEGISPPKPKSKKAVRRPFNNEEAKAILLAARAQKGALRWLPWLCCLTGARISEVCQAVKEDVSEISGVTVLRIHDEGADGEDGVRSIKNEDSRRIIPIHPALVAEGFLDYVRALPARSPLFPDVAPAATFQQRGITAAKRVSRWLRRDLNITATDISPNHSWRHWFIDACRLALMHPEIRSALTGHSAKLDESAGYGAGMGSLVAILAEAIATVEPPLGPPEAADR